MSGDISTVDLSDRVSGTVVSSSLASSDIEPLSLLWASPDRAGEVAALHAELFDPPWSCDTLRGHLEDPGAAALIAMAGLRREPAGFVIARVAADEAEILSLGVVGRFQRRGLGRSLMEGLLRAVSRADARRLFLEVGVDNTPALRLYDRLEFRRVGIRPRYYQRPGSSPVDALVLARDL